MKKQIFALIAAAVLSQQAAAGDEWRAEDTYRQAGVTSLLVADWFQTRHIAKHPQEYQEIGWAHNFIGNHPTVNQVNQYFTSAIILDAAIAYALPRGWRDAWQYSGIVIEADVVRKNISIGLRISL